MLVCGCPLTFRPNFCREQLHNLHSQLAIAVPSVRHAMVSGPTDDAGVELDALAEIKWVNSRAVICQCLPRGWWQRSLQGKRTGRNVSMTMSGWPAHTVAVDPRKQVCVTLAVLQRQYCRIFHLT